MIEIVSGKEQAKLKIESIRDYIICLDGINKRILKKIEKKFIYNLERLQDSNIEDIGNGKINILNQIVLYFDDTGIKNPYIIETIVKEYFYPILKYYGYSVIEIILEYHNDTNFYLKFEEGKVPIVVSLTVNY